VEQGNASPFNQQKLADVDRMSNFKCGLRRFDGHGNSNSCSSNSPVAKEVESAYSRMMRQREQQDRGDYTRTTEYRPERDEPKVVVPEQSIRKGLTGVPVAAEQHLNSKFATYSLSDANPNKNTE
jgi:hypothetical protein